MKNYKELIAHCEKALKNKVQYIYGAKMQVLSRAQIQELQNTYGKSLVWDSDLNKAGKMCCDCSGLISSCTGIERNSSNYKDTALEVVNISQLKSNWSKYVGYGLWKQGHIGVVSDTSGHYYAMDNSTDNMVHNHLNKQNWTCAIKLKDINYVAEKQDVFQSGFLKVNGRQIKIDFIFHEDEPYIKLKDLKNADLVAEYDKSEKMYTLDNLIKILPINFEGEAKGIESLNLHGYNFVNLRPTIAMFGYGVDSYNPETKEVAISFKE